MKEVDDIVDGVVVGKIEIECDDPVHNRGRCECHYGRWYNERRSMTREQKIEFDRSLIELGRLLDQQGKREYQQQDAFARLARRVRRRA